MELDRHQRKSKRLWRQRRHQQHLKFEVFWVWLDSIPDSYQIFQRSLSRCALSAGVFEWGLAQEDAFRILKQRIVDATSLAYFRQSAPTKLITDASPVGLGAVLVQTQDSTDRALCYVSRTLSDVERRHSQVEKEPLAVVWACERFDLYLFGLPKFQLITNKAVQFLFSPRSKPFARIERWVLCLMNYQYEVVHVSVGRKHCRFALPLIWQVSSNIVSQE